MHLNEFLFVCYPIVINESRRHRFRYIIKNAVNHHLRKKKFDIIEQRLNSIEIQYHSPPTQHNRIFH